MLRMAVNRMSRTGSRQLGKSGKTQQEFCVMQKYLKGKVYKTMIRPVLMYGAETWSVTRREEGPLERTEIRMPRRILGVSLKDKKRNEVIRKMLRVACINEKIREARLRWYCHVMRREDENSMKRIMTAEVNGRHSRGQQKKRWGDIIQQDMKSLRLKKEHTADRKKWRGRIQVADSFPVRD